MKKSQLSGRTLKRIGGPSTNPINHSTPAVSSTSLWRCYEQFVLDAEAIAMVAYFMGPTPRPAEGKYFSMGAFHNCEALSRAQLRYRSSIKGQCTYFIGETVPAAQL